MRSIDDPPPRTALARFDPDFGQRFLLTVEAGQPSDWNRPTARHTAGLDRDWWLMRFQQFCEGEGVVPLYLVDRTTARSAAVAEVLRGPLATGTAELGIHLDSWTDPPFDEDLATGNASAGQLPHDVEQASFIALRDEIERNFQVAPAIFRAGCRGVGRDVLAALVDQGIAIDTSVRAGFDFSEVGGADFHRHPLAPYWLDDNRRLLELPPTTVFWGLLRRQGQWLHPAMRHIPRLRELLARTGLLKRITLKSGGNSVDEAICGIDIALDDGLPLLVFTFESPSLSRLQTGTVHSEEDLDALHDWWVRVFAYLTLRKVAPASVAQVMQAVQR